jgi:hypothetical protein
MHDRAHALFGQAAHLEQPSLERFELFLEVANNPLFHVSSTPRRSRRRLRHKGHEDVFGHKGHKDHKEFRKSKDLCGLCG